MQDLVLKLKRAALGAIAAACVAALLAWSPRSSGHGGLSMDEDTCKLRVGRYVMHFVGYQPDSRGGPQEFCEDIPETGRTIVVLDYVDPELRDLPTEVRVIRDTGSAPQRIEDVTVLHLPPKLYPTGSLNFELEFAQPGKFVGLVTVGGAEKFESRFPFSVGRTYSWLHLLIPAALVVAGSVALYRFGMRRRGRAAASLPQ